MILKSLNDSSLSHIAQNKQIAVECTASLIGQKKSHQIIPGCYMLFHLEIGIKKINSYV